MKGYPLGHRLSARPLRGDDASAAGRNALCPSRRVGRLLGAFIFAAVLLGLCTAVGCGPASAPSDGAATPAVTVAGQAFTMDALRALQQGTAEVEGTSYSGVQLSALLAAAGVTEGTVTLSATDGYRANVAVADLTPDCVLAYTEGGTLNAVLPSLTKATWVREVVEISVTEAPLAAPTAGDAEPLGGPVSVVDAAGRTVTLENLPRRIAVIGTGPHMSLHLLYMFPEGRERLVGAESRSSTASDFLPFVDSAFAQVPTLGANPNVEQIAALAPDLVIMKGTVVNETAEALAQIDVPVVYLGLETVEQFFLDVANLGTVLGNPSRAEEIAAFYRSRLDRLATGLADLQEEDKPRVLLLEYSDRGGQVAVQVPARAWMQTAEVEYAGGHPVWLDSAAPTDGWTIANLEQIARWDADQIYVIIWYTLDPQAVIDRLKADPQWSSLRAVRDGHLYAFPQDIFGWDQPEPRWILGMTWLAAHVHPERLGDVDMDTEVRTYFGELYGMSEEAIERDILPRVRMDVR